MTGRILPEDVARMNNDIDRNVSPALQMINEYVVEETQKVPESPRSTGSTSPVSPITNFFRSINISGKPSESILVQAARLPELSRNGKFDKVLEILRSSKDQGKKIPKRTLEISLLEAVKNGQIDLLKLLKHETDVDINTTDDDNNTPLDIALQKNDAELIQELKFFNAKTKQELVTGGKKQRKYKKQNKSKKHTNKRRHRKTKRRSKK